MHDMQDHPIIRNYQKSGYWNGKEPTFPKCPVCGEEADTIYIDKFHEIVGCENCITKTNSWEVEL